MSIRHFDTRVEMIEALAGGCDTFVEIGVFIGLFSQEILDAASPKKLILVDRWQGTCSSGDENGNNVVRMDGEKLQKAVRALYKGRAAVIRQDSTEFLEKAVDKYDVVYLDADHSYEAVRNQLAMCDIAVRKGGWIMGHDYCTNPNKNSTGQEFGVAKAVNRFVRISDWELAALAWDGCVSFALRRKTDAV